VFLPHLPGNDFDDLFERAIEVVGEEDGISQDELNWHVRWPEWDRLDSRTVGVNSLPFSLAIEKQVALRDILEATALSVAKRGERYIRGGRPSVVRDYIGGAKLIPAARGSFVVRALLPLEKDKPSLPIGNFEFRRFTEAIPTVLDSAAAAASDIADRGAPLERWEEAVEAGVTSNLCDGLARHLATSSASIAPPDNFVEIGVHLRGGRQGDGSPQPNFSMSRLSLRLGPIFSAGRSYLMGQPENFVLSVQGQITRLSKRGADGLGPGKISVSGRFSDWDDDDDHSLTVEVDEITHSQAVRAYEAATPVRLQVEVRREPTKLVILRLVSYEELATGSDGRTSSLDDDTSDSSSVLFEGLNQAKK
jgi:hypothetical protein